MGHDAFVGDEKTIDAVVRNLQIIGEAASRLPTAFPEKHAEIPWKRAIGLRHCVVHDYFGKVKTNPRTGDRPIRPVSAIKTGAVLIDLESSP